VRIYVTQLYSQNIYNLEGQLIYCQPLSVEKRKIDKQSSPTEGEKGGGEREREREREKIAVFPSIVSSLLHCERDDCAREGRTEITSYHSHIVRRARLSRVVST